MYWFCDGRWFPSMGCDCDICEAQTVGLEWVIGRGPQWLLESGSQTPKSHMSLRIRAAQSLHSKISQWE